MDKDTLIIQKLLKIAKNQQKILEKLAQTTNIQNDANVKYLKEAAEVAALNTGFSTTNVNVRNESSEGLGTSPGSDHLIILKQRYSINIQDAPKDNKIRQKFIDTFLAQIKTQKPEIADKIEITFAG